MLTEEHLANIDQQMKNLVKREEFKDLAKDLDDCVTKQEFSVLDESFKNMKKDYSCFMKLDDFALKMSVILQELEAKLNDRPTFKQSKQTISALEEKYDGLTQSLSE